MVKRSSPSHSAHRAQELTNLNLLAVDDDADTLRLLALVLTARGAHVNLAASTREALHAARATRPDVVLADLAMPSEDGFTLLSQLRADPKFHDVPVVAVTAHARSEDRDHCIAAGFDTYISKPFDTNEVIDVIVRLTKSKARSHAHDHSRRPTT